MSVNRTDYIVYGWKFPNPMLNNMGQEVDLWDDKYLPYIEGHQGIDYIIVRNDNYVVFGFCIASGGDKYNGWEFEQLVKTAPPADVVKAKYGELFGNGQDISNPTLFIFSNFQ